jgi:hypothetical protein
MRFISLSVVALSLVLGACSRKVPTEDPAFESRWKDVTAANEAVVVGDEQALALSASVRKAQATPPAVAAGGGLPEQPAGHEVDRVIRSNLGAVKGCYLTAARGTSGRSGKAIVSFSIGSDGRPANVQVDAPSFKDTKLPTCISSQVSFWSFPRSRKGAGAVSYPFVFVGG